MRAIGDTHTERERGGTYSNKTKNLVPLKRELSFDMLHCAFPSNSSPSISNLTNTNDRNDDASLLSAALHRRLYNDLDGSSSLITLDVSFSFRFISLWNCTVACVYTLSEWDNYYQYWHLMSERRNIQQKLFAILIAIVATIYLQMKTFSLSLFFFAVYFFCFCVQLPVSTYNVQLASTVWRTRTWCHTV